MYDIRKIPENVRAFVEATNRHALFPHQKDMLLACDRPGVLRAATGVGKTYALGALAASGGGASVIVTPRNIINEQTLNTFFDPVLFGLSADQVGVYDRSVSAREKQKSLTKPILITTYYSFQTLVNDGRISPNPLNPFYRGNVVLDEAHRATGEGFMLAIQPFLESCFVTAWTATDQFIDGSHVSDHLFGGQDRLYNLPITTAVEQGLLCHAIRAMVVEMGIDTADWEDIRAKHNDYPEHLLEKFALNEALQKQAVKMYGEYTHKESGISFFGKPTLVTTTGVTAAKRTADKFNSAFGPNTAIALAGKTPDRIKQDAFDAFEAGEIKVICAADLLVEGFDSKDVTLVLSLRPTVSPWLLEQILGRGARQQSSEYFGHFGHDKQLIAVNFIGEGMAPLLFSDIIGGHSIENISGNMREPSEKSTRKRVRASRSEIVVDVPTAVHVTEEEVASITRKRDVIREVSTDKSDHPNMLMRSELHPTLAVAITSENGIRLRTMMDEMEAEFRKVRLESKPLIYKGVEIKCGFYRSGNQSPFCVDRKHIPDFKKWFGFDVVNEGEIPKNMVSKDDYQRFLHIDTNSSFGKKFHALWDEMTEAAKLSPGGTFEHQGETLHGGIYRSINHRVLFLSKDDAPIVRKLIGMAEKKPDDHFGISGCATALKIQTKSKEKPHLVKIFSDMEALYKSQGNQMGPAEINYRGMDIECGVYKAGPNTIFCVKDTLKDKVREWIEKDMKGPDAETFADKAESRAKKPRTGRG